MLIKRFLFFLLSSFSLASAGYFLVSLFLKYPFGRLYRMNLYHEAFPYQYILVTCIVYSVIASYFCMRFLNRSPMGRIGVTALLILLTVVISSPPGGMLWHVHDMQAGFWPTWWMRKLFQEGPLMGIRLGWVVILGSIPYNVFGVFICYWLTDHGAQYFATPSPASKT